MEDIRSIKVNIIDNQFNIFVFSCCHSSVVLLYCGLVSESLEVGAVAASLLSALFEKEDWGEGEAEDPTHVMAPLGTQQTTHHTSHNDNHNYKKNQNYWDPLSPQPHSASNKPHKPELEIHNDTRSLWTFWALDI